jgi:hypothetical protein
MVRRMWWVALPALLALAGPMRATAGPQAKADEQPSTSKKAIPVAPETRRKIHSSFVKHGAGPVDRLEETRSAVFAALLADDLATAESLQVELQQRAADLDAAKIAMSGELGKAGISKAVQEQEWTSWVAKRKAAREAKTPAS